MLQRLMQLPDTVWAVLIVVIALGIVLIIGLNRYQFKRKRYYKKRLRQTEEWLAEARGQVEAMKEELIYAWRLVNTLKLQQGTNLQQEEVNAEGTLTSENDIS